MSDLIINKIRIAKLHLKRAIEVKQGLKKLGNEDELIELCNKQIIEFTNQLNIQTNEENRFFKSVQYYGTGSVNHFLS